MGSNSKEEIKKMKDLQKIANAGSIVSDNVFDKSKIKEKTGNSQKGGENLDQVTKLADGRNVNLRDLSVSCDNAPIQGVVITPEQLKVLLGDNKQVLEELSTPLTFTGLCIAHLLSEGFDINARGKTLSDVLTKEYNRRNNYASSIEPAKNFFNSL